MTGKEILCTKDYALFRQYKEQRELTPATTAKVMRSMKKRGFVASKPIIVNSRMEVIDGQHRLQVAKNLSSCVYYVIDDTLNVEDVRELAAAQAGWSIDDYVTSHIRQGLNDYARLRELKELSCLAWQSFLYAVFVDAKDRIEQIKSGKLNLSKTKEDAILEFISKFEMFKPLCKHWGHRSFVVACSQLFSHPQYDHEQMRARLAYQQSRLIRCANVADHLDVLAAIYNYKSHAHNVVDFTRRPK